MQWQKVAALADLRDGGVVGVEIDGLPLAFHLTGGEVGDSPLFKLLLDLGPDVKPRAALADKGYDAKANRALARARGIAPAIPFKSNAKDPPALQARHDMMRAKLVGFQERPDGVARRYPISDNSMPALYARAISAYRYGSVSGAIAQIDALIAREPSNPYFQELKGQALLEAGRAGQAVAPLRKAVEMTNGAPLIRAMLGQALVEAGNPAYTDEAIRELLQATQRDPDSSSGWRALAKAYDRKNNRPAAYLASSQASLASGDFRTARELAARAREGFRPIRPAG